MNRADRTRAKVGVELDGKKAHIAKGYARADELYSMLRIDPGTEAIILEDKGGAEVPILPRDRLSVRGGEKFSIRPVKHKIPDNPDLKDARNISVNGEDLRIADKAKITANQLCKRVDADAANSSLYWVSGDHNDRYIDGRERLIVRESDAYIILPGKGRDVIDLEKCARDGMTPPSGSFIYRIKIDGDKYDFKAREVTGEELMSRAGKKYGEWSLNRKLSAGRRVPLEAEQLVDLSEPGVERFETVRRQAQQGA